MRIWKAWQRRDRRHATLVRVAAPNPTTGGMTLKMTCHEYVRRNKTALIFEITQPLNQPGCSWNASGSHSKWDSFESETVGPASESSSQDQPPARGPKSALPVRPRAQSHQHASNANAGSRYCPQWTAHGVLEPSGCAPWLI